MTYIQECLTKFQELPSSAKEKIGGAESFNIIKELEKKYKVSLSFLVVLLAVGELVPEDIYDYIITRYQLEPILAKTLSQEIKTRIFNPFLGELRETNGLDLKQTLSTSSNLPSAGNDKEIILRIFSNQLVKTLQVNKFDDLQKLNILIFKTFQNDNSFEDKIIDIFYNSPELLTSKGLALGNRTVSPTISHWLKDFIEYNGSESFNELSLEQYLINSVNAKKLPLKEKNLLRKLLKLYRNLVFFAESTEGIPLENWEIFPVNHSEETQPAPKIEDVLATSPEPVLSDNSSTQLMDLEKTIKKYPSSSLEYKALNQEIKHLKHKN